MGLNMARKAHSLRAQMDAVTGSDESYPAIARVLDARRRRHHGDGAMMHTPFGRRDPDLRTIILQLGWQQFRERLRYLSTRHAASLPQRWLSLGTYLAGTIKQQAARFWLIWSSRAATRAEQLRAARQFALRLRCRAAMSTWLGCSADCKTVVWEASAAAQRTRQVQMAALFVRWSSWTWRMLQWLQRVERRLVTLGSSRQHLPCMRDFDVRAIFVEEGYAVMATRYRNRRVKAVVLVCWATIRLRQQRTSVS